MRNEIFSNISKIIERGSKTTTYKFALLRGVIDIIQDNSPYIYYHYQPTKTKFLSILFLYYSYPNIYNLVFSFLKTYLPSKEGHLCGCRALVAAYPALGVCPPAFSYYPHQV